MAISPEHVRHLCKETKQYYNPNLPYHNWSHAEEVMRESELVRARLGRRGAQVNRSLMLLSAAGHDAGHDHDAAEQYESKEHYSIELARRHLADALSDDEFSVVEDAILGTRLGASRDTPEALILHYADVANMGYAYPGFLDHSVKLWREYGAGDWRVFRAQSEKIINQTIDESLRELSPAIASQSDPYYFVTPARRNVQQILREDEPL